MLAEKLSLLAIGGAGAAGAALAIGSSLMAAGEGVDPVAIGTMLANGGAVAAVVWLVWHQTTHTLPNMQEAYFKQLAEVQVRHNEHFALVREAHHNELLMLKEMFTAATNRFDESIDNLQGTIREFGQSQEQQRKESARTLMDEIDKRLLPRK